MARTRNRGTTLKEKKEYIFLKTLNRVKNLKGCTKKRAAVNQPK
jgi:hypothetical protein